MTDPLPDFIPLTVALALVLILGGCEAPEVPRPDERPEVPSASVFTEITAAVGLEPPRAAWPDGTYALPEIMGGGVALLDYDGDGDLDLLQVVTPPPGQSETPAPNRLFRQGADGTFEEVTGASGLGDPGYGQGVAIGDVDNDGHPDVFFTNFGADAFYRNNGDGTFRNDTAAAGLGDGQVDAWSTSAAFVDYDRDGDLDLYVVNYVVYDPAMQCSMSTGVPDYCGPQEFGATLDTLYRNRGDGTFEDVTAQSGIHAPGRGLGVVTVDLTGDGWIDIYVANDGEVNQLWVNQRDGTFSDEAVIRGLGFNVDGQPEASMGIAVGDVNGDAAIDLFLTHLMRETNTLYLSGERGLYTDASGPWGLSSIDRPFTGFGCGFFDYDNDGDLDLALVNGAVFRESASMAVSGSDFWTAFGQSNLLYENTDRRFAPRQSEGGALTHHREVSRGLAFGDIDGDGDVDLAEGTLAGIRVYRNDATKPDSHWLQVRAIAHNRDAIGASLILDTGEKRILRMVLPAYSYASSSDPRVHFGLRAAPARASLEVIWPDGAREQFEVPGVDEVITVRKGTGTRL